MKNCFLNSVLFVLKYLNRKKKFVEKMKKEFLQNIKIHFLLNIFIFLEKIRRKNRNIEEY